MNETLLTYTLTDALPEDLPAIVDIYNTTIAGRMVTADLEPIAPTDRQAWYDEHSPDLRPLWTLKNSSGAVVAWLSYQSFHPRAAYNGTAEVSIYLSPLLRGQGLGGLLLQRALEACPGLGIHSLVGLVFGHNEPSLRLFQKHGFEIWGRLPRVAILDGIERDLVYVGRKV
ncbi:GNAT family N-acetyltransferase [Paenibacillus herberti]|uniref:N-acetyltransferase n=1 Tax=Paenibacillus herberti TaxID=1619309 RepID=A0A229NZ38_9BACL|nr:GNAT family N-acetyltransferase [Paenibacillus herberti]OXM14919.1 N-acetyltransferase [Paenibacillus herberti]